MFGFHTIKQYERAVVFHLGRVNDDDARGPGLIFLIPLVNRVRRVSLRIVTMPIQSQGIITSDNVSIDVSAVAYYHVEDPVRSVLAIENVSAAIDQIAQTTLRAVVGRHTLDETLSETDKINDNIREILDVQTEEWGVKVTVVELKDIQLPDSMQRAMARQAEAEREKRAKIIAAQGEALAAGELGRASDEMMAHPLALQLRNLQTMVEIGVDKNSTIMFPAPLMSTIEEVGAFLSREAGAAVLGPRATADTPPPVLGKPEQTGNTPDDDPALVPALSQATDGVSVSSTSGRSHTTSTPSGSLISATAPRSRGRSSSGGGHKPKSVQPPLQLFPSSSGPDDVSEPNVDSVYNGRARPRSSSFSWSAEPPLAGKAAFTFQHSPYRFHIELSDTPTCRPAAQPGGVDDKD